MSRFQFFPSGERGRAIDRNMRVLLGESFQHIAAQAAGILDFKEQRLRPLIDGLMAGHRYPPSTFALFADLVFAIEDDDYVTAAELLGCVENERPLQDAPWQVVALGGSPGSDRDRRYLRLMDTDPSTRFSMVPPAPAVAAEFRGRLSSGFCLMADAIPELAEEIAHLVSQVIMVAGDPGARYQFDGGSSYMLWGGLFLNATSHNTDVAMVEVLAHESAHILLFGFASDEPLVLNDDIELYPSPLRIDPRPMDGIYHSTYVSARMHWAMTRLLDSGLLNAEACGLAEAARAADRRNFFDGSAVVEKYARLTDTGQAVMASALDYMKSA